VINLCCMHHSCGVSWSRACLVERLPGFDCTRGLTVCAVTIQEGKIFFSFGLLVNDVMIGICFVFFYDIIGNLMRRGNFMAQTFLDSRL